MTGKAVEEILRSLESMSISWLPFVGSYRTFLVNDGGLLENSSPSSAWDLLTSLDHMEIRMMNPSAQEL
jgi:hypothetical protein